MFAPSLHQVWTSLDSSRHIWTILDKFEQLQTCLDNFRLVKTNLDKKCQFQISLNKFRQIQTSSTWSNNHKSSNRYTEKTIQNIKILNHFCKWAATNSLNNFFGWTHNGYSCYGCSQCVVQSACGATHSLLQFYIWSKPSSLSFESLLLLRKAGEWPRILQPSK